MKQKYTIGELEFKTKKDCENYTRNKIHELGCCEIKKDNSNFNFFNNLLKNHSEYENKKGCGIEYFYIEPNPLNKKYYQTMIKRTDGSKTDFSWVYCCQFKPRTVNEDLIRAMRNAIKDDVIKYKQSQNKLICNYCKSETELYEDYHVDHDNPSFQVLKDNYLLTTTKQKPTSFGECEIYKLTIFKDEDNDFEIDWINYHKLNCNFQILCRTCNLKKKKD